jgi:hypothetical protein
LRSARKIWRTGENYWPSIQTTLHTSTITTKLKSGAIMMAHFAGPFDDSAFYDEHEDQEMVEYFDNARREDNLYEDMEFRKMIVQMVAKELGVH